MGRNRHRAAIGPWPRPEQRVTHRRAMVLDSRPVVNVPLPGLFHPPVTCGMPAERAVLTISMVPVYTRLRPAQTLSFSDHHLRDMPDPFRHRSWAAGREISEKGCSRPAGLWDDARMTDEESLTAAASGQEARMKKPVGYLDPSGSESTRKLRETARRRRDAEQKLEHHLRESKQTRPV